jgi:hypothetical protein
VTEVAREDSEIDGRRRDVKSGFHAPHNEDHQDTDRPPGWLRRRYSHVLEEAISRLAHHDTALKTLYYVTAEPGVTYDKLERALPVGRRQIKGIVGILRDLGLVVTKSCPAHVYPADFAAELCIKYILEVIRPTLVEEDSKGVLDRIASHISSTFDNTIKNPVREDSRPPPD